MQKNNTTKIEAQGGEIVIRNSFDDVAIIPRNLVKKYQAYMKAGCDECIDELVASLPAMSQYAADGTVIPQGKKVKVTLPDGEQAEYSTESVEYKNLYNSGKLANVVKDKVTGEDTYVMPSLKEVEIVGKATGAARDMIDTKKNYTKEQYIKEKLPAFAGSLGVTANNLGGNAEGYKRAINTKVAENILKRKPNAKEKDLTPYELEIVSNSDLDYKIRANLGERFEQGVLSVGNAGSPVKFKSPNLTQAQAERESTPLNMLAPLEAFPKTVRKLIGDDDKPNILKDVALDPLNLLGLGLIDDLPKLGNIGKGLKNLVAERQFTKRNVVKEMSASDKLTDFRDGISALNYTENPDKIYRTINKTQLEDILETGKLRTPKEAGVKGKNNFRDNIQWYKGHAASRYGDIAIEAPNKAHKIEDLIFHIPDGNGNMVAKTFNELSKERQIAGRIDGLERKMSEAEYAKYLDLMKIKKAASEVPVMKSVPKYNLDYNDRDIYKLIETVRNNKELTAADKQTQMISLRLKTKEGQHRAQTYYEALTPLELQAEKEFQELDPITKTLVHAFRNKYGHYDPYSRNAQKQIDNLVYGKHTELGAYYSPTTHEIRYASELDDSQTIRHELEHSLQEMSTFTPIDRDLQDNFKLLDKEALYDKTDAGVLLRRRIGKYKKEDRDLNYVEAARYFNVGSGGQEKSAFLAELQAYAIKHKYITHEYQKMTPKIVEQMVKEAKLDPQKALRILGIGEESADNYKLIADNFNKLLGLTGAGIIGGSMTARSLKDQLNKNKSK